MRKQKLGNDILKTLFLQKTYCKTTTLCIYTRYERGVVLIFQTILTVCAVSADSLFAGFSVALGKKTNLIFPLTVAFVTFVLCAVAVLLGNLLKSAVNVNVVSAVLLALLGLVNLLKKDGETHAQNFGEYALVGVAVGTDAATSCVSLALTTNYGFWLPLTMGVTHFLTVFVGTKLAKVCKKLSPKACNVIAGVVLLILAVLKLMQK